MKKNDLLKHVVPGAAKERESFRMSFQTSTEIIDMIDCVVDSKGKRGALKDALASWMTGFDNLLSESAVELLREMLDGRSDTLLSEHMEKGETDNEDSVKTHALLALLSIGFNSGLEVANSLKFKNKVNKTYTLSYAAKNALLSISQKLSIKNSEAFNLATIAFCKFYFDFTQRKEKEAEAQANVLMPFFEKMSNTASEALKSLTSILESNEDIFDPEVGIHDIAGVFHPESNIEMAIGQFVRATYEIEDAADIVRSELKNKL